MAEKAQVNIVKTKKNIKKLMKMLPADELKLLKGYQEFKDGTDMTPIMQEIFIDTEQNNATVTKLRQTIENKVQKIRELKLDRDRKQIQLNGKIYEHLDKYNEQMVTPAELKSDIARIDLLIAESLFDVKQYLSNLAKYCGIPKAGGRGFVITIEEHDAYVTQLDKTLKEDIKVGYGLLK